MTPQTATSHIDVVSLQRLSTTIGTRWRFITGRPLAQRPGSLIAIGIVVAATDAGEFSILNEMDVLRFEGFEEEYPRLSVRDADVNLLKASRASGHVFFHHDGQEVRRVLIVREEITALRRGEVEWVYSTDIGVIFELFDGAVGVAKAGHHDEVMFISFADTVDELDLPDRTIEWDWDNELGEEYRTRRDFLDVQSLLDDEPPAQG